MRSLRASACMEHARHDALRATFTTCLPRLCLSGARSPSSGDSPSDDDYTNTNTNHHGVRRVRRAHPDEPEGLLDDSPSSPIRTPISQRMTPDTTTAAERDDATADPDALSPAHFASGVWFVWEREARGWGDGEGGWADSAVGIRGKQRPRTDDFLARTTLDGGAPTQLEERDAISADVASHASPSFPSSVSHSRPSAQRLRNVNVTSIAHEKTSQPPPAVPRPP
ncbi:hypothetical protein MSAN_01686200 [Mycena sanguinolenta]|uniref:Uncharacterized protein n=1 Tax=Mycena sanguinolenta TaxID=230812 RepID=A0A8H6XWN1_9AGAR|nr:hypothetical protein MSAN_01686200 [Mycena sanguinolenta]